MSSPNQPSQKPGNPPPTRDPLPSDVGDKTKMPPRRTWLWFVIILIFNYYLMSTLFPDPSDPVTVPYTVFKEEVARGNVKSIYSKGETITGEFDSPITYPPPGEEQPEPEETDSGFNFVLGPGEQKPVEIESFTTTLPSFLDPGLEAFLIEQEVEILARPIQEAVNPILTFLIRFGPALLIIFFYVWLYRRARGAAGGMGGLGGSFMGMGKSKAKRFDLETDGKVTFDDVAGIDEAENELAEIVDFLKNPEKYTRLGGAAPKGVLLVGAPGTGKTLLARAVAGESGVPFFSMSASEFIEMVVGVGASRVRDLFKQARENSPSIIFIDELDSIGRARGQSVVGGSSEQEQTLNQILTEMDGFSSKEGVIVLAATNQPEVLDKALLRPGRFDRRVVVNLPDKIGREAILKVHTRKVPLSDDVNLTEIASTTPGLSGADLRNLVNEAALLAARRAQDQVAHSDFLDALEKIVLGPERPLLMSFHDRERIAYHEAGHAILGLVVPGADPVNRVTIVPRGQALGVTYQRPDSDRYNYPEAYLRARIIGIMGGRAAEELVFNSKTTGAENDIEQATNLAVRMVTRWGMSDKLGMVQLAAPENPYLSRGQGGYGSSKAFSEETARMIDVEVFKIIKDSEEEAKRLLNLHRKELDALANALLEQETLDEHEILEVTGLPASPPLEFAKTAPQNSGGNP